jgi:signal transduction histidine kinase
MGGVTDTQLAELWQARLDRWGRLLLLPLLAASTALAAISVADGYRTWARFDHGLIAVGAAGVWSAALSRRPRPAAQTGYRAATFVVHCTLSAVLVWVNPWYGVFAYTAYFFADDLPAKWRKVGCAVTAFVLAASQCGGYPSHWSGQSVEYVTMVAFNLIAISGFLKLTEKVLEQNQQRGQTIAELAEANRQLEATMIENAGLHAQLLVQAREAGVVEERQRLAGEIHDTLAQGLAGIVAQLEAAELALHHPAEVTRYLAQARSLARSSLTEARRSVRALRPEQLEAATLPEAIGELARSWSARSTVPVHVKIAGTPIRADVDTETAIFRAAQEALSNVAKHAQASEVHLTLTYLDDALLLDVADDGAGFDTAIRAGGYGLVGMQERLARASGKLTVESTPGYGTTINASLPLVGHPVAAHQRDDPIGASR